MAARGRLGLVLMALAGLAAGGCITTNACLRAGDRTPVIDRQLVLETPAEAAGQRLLCLVRVQDSGYVELARNRKVVIVDREAWRTAAAGSGVRLVEAIAMEPPADVLADIAPERIGPAIGPVDPAIGIRATALGWTAWYGVPVRLLLPAAMAFDIVTFPFQVLYVLGQQAG